MKPDFWTPLHSSYFGLYKRWLSISVVHALSSFQYLNHQLSVIKDVIDHVKWS